jgi:hypothetical protein
MLVHGDRRRDITLRLGAWKVVVGCCQYLGRGHSSLPGTANTFCGILTASAVLERTEQETLDLICGGKGRGSKGSNQIFRSPTSCVAAVCRVVICTNRAEIRATPPRPQVHDAKLISNTRANVPGWADQASVTVSSTVFTSACAASHPSRLMLLASHEWPIDS